MAVKHVGTMTFHMAHNYGAMLQAYALPVAVCKVGHECEVIDYRFPYIDQWGRVEYLPALIKRHGLMGGSLRYVKRVMTGQYSSDLMRTKFSKFEDKVIPCSEKVYRDSKELNGVPYDVILFGSDQIWNSALTNGEAPEYIGGFETLPHTRKVAYAASCGYDDFQPESRESYMKHLVSFHAVGVREQGFADTLRQRGIDAKVVLDPTLLLNREEWLQMVQRVRNRFKPTGKYMLLYIFDEDERIYDVARKVASERGLEIIAIAYKQKECMHGMQVLTNCGPAEFVELFANADAVLTTSFHGTAFSIIMQRDFYCVPHPKYRARTDSLLTLLGLQQRNMERLEDVGQRPAIDWHAVQNTMKKHREASYAFLKDALE